MIILKSLSYSLLLGLLNENVADIMRLLLLVVATITMVNACDPKTQYESNGTCCKMCEPGTRMSSSNNDCLDPQCKPCAEDEYQDAYTINTKCKLQPYCDPNKNFDVKNDKSPMQLHQCTCKTNFHCSSDQCIMCIPNTRCTPGQQITFKGNRTKDTVCQPCPAGTYSNDGLKCLAWKICEAGDEVETKGTDRLDAACVKSSDGNSSTAIVAVGILLSVVVLVSLLIGLLVWKNKDARATWRKSKGYCMELCAKRKQEDANGNTAGQPERNPAKFLIAHPEEHSVLISIAVENEETQVPVQTENGHLLEQEHGKAELVSQTDSSFDSTKFSSVLPEVLR